VELSRVGGLEEFTRVVSVHHVKSHLDISLVAAISFIRVARV
jgi:hypothetical protein